MSRYLPVVFVAVALSTPGPLAQTPSAPSSQQQPEIVHIDGSRNPELIPQWSAWGFAFRVVAGGSRLLPSVVHEVASKDEAAIVLKEADAIQAVDRACEGRVSKLRPLLGRERADVLDAKLREITLECRQKTLDARDRLLNGLNPQAAAALMMFVESTKSGTSLSIPRKDLTRFLEPE